VGLIADHSPLGQSLLEIAKQPKARTLSEVAQAKCREIRSEAGRSGYELAIKAWTTLIGSHELGSLTTENLNRYLDRLVTVGWSGKPVGADTANGMAQKLVSLIKWLNQEDGGNRKVPSFKRRKSDPFALRLAHRDKATRKDEVRRVLDHCWLNGLTDKFLWVLLVDNTTLRVSESLSLRWGDLIQREGKWFFDLKSAKTPSGIRYVPLNSRLLTLLMPHRGDPEQPVISNTWQQLKRPRSGPENWCQKVKKKLGLEGTFRPHAFRHGAGGDLGYTQTEHTKKMLMGHKGGITDLYTRADLMRMAEAAEEIGTSWEPPRAPIAAKAIND
jgi:integrase